MSEFNFSEPSEIIQVELTDGRVIEGPRGKTVGEFLEILRPELGPDLMAAIVNGEMQELTYVLNRPAVIRPVTIKDAHGFIIYKRTLVFLLAACFEKCSRDTTSKSSTPSQAAARSATSSGRNLSPSRTATNWKVPCGKW